MSDARQNGASTPVVVTLGNPNTGKSTLFNALTGLRQKVSNYPGVTVEQVSGQLTLDGLDVRLVDVPGTYTLAASSPDEIIAVDVLCGRVAGLPQPDAALVVIDATNLRRNLFLLTQILEAGIPTLVALNMTDRLAASGIEVDVKALEDRLGVPVVAVSAAEKTGIEQLRQQLKSLLLGARPTPPSLGINPRLDAAVAELAAEFEAGSNKAHALEIRRALLDGDGLAEQRLAERLGETRRDRLVARRETLAGGRNLATLEARDRYSFIQGVLNSAEKRIESHTRSWSDRLDTILNHPLSGSFIFILLMALVFQAVFAWAAPLVDGIDYLTGALAAAASGAMGSGLLSSFVSDGIIAGVGSVVIFLPQILLLFAFIIVLEDSGYMARAAFLMDRVMRGVGLSGQSFIPMLSSFACAVPGIMGARIVASREDRISTIIAAPFITCSARLPVYSLLIAAFVPADDVLGGWLNLQGLVLLALYLLGIVGAALTAWLINKLQRTRSRGRFLLEMPPYRAPRIRAVLAKLLSRAVIFLRRAGTIIFAVALVVWALATFPRNDSAGDFQSPPLAESYLGRAGQFIAPVFAPLGWDWKVTAAVLASFPAREVVIAALGTIYAVEDDSTDLEGTLTTRIRHAQHADGTPVYTLPMVVGLLIFYALCLQCVSTIAVMYRETGSWRWPGFAWCYMTALGYGGALLVYQLGTSMGIG